MALRVRTTGAYGAVFGVFFRQKLGGQAVHGRRRRHAIARFHLRDRRRQSVSLPRRRPDIVGERFNVGAGDPKSINQLVDLLGGDVVHVPKRPGEPDCTWADIGKITSQLGWRAEVPFEQGVPRMMQQIHLWKDAPLWDPDSIANATKTWFEYLGETQA